ncbi:MAG: cation-transporting P-type ATPase [Arcobacteraceae bacterium]
MEELEEKSWHNLEPEYVISYLRSDFKKGLTLQESIVRQKYFGLNQLTPKKETSLLVDFLLQFHTPLVYICTLKI